MSRASLKPAKQNGTSPAQTIRASGPRPHQQAEHKTASDPIANISRPLAMREPSTQDILGRRRQVEGPASPTLHRAFLPGLSYLPRKFGLAWKGAHAEHPMGMTQINIERPYLSKGQLSTQSGLSSGRNRLRGRRPMCLEPLPPSFNGA